MTAKIFGYIRVSTKDQNFARQIESLKKYVPDTRDIYSDKFTRSSFDRPGYQSLKYNLRAGDTLYVHSLDRLGGNKAKIKEELKYLTDTGVIVRILDVPTTLMDYSQFGNLQKSIMDMVNQILIEVLSTFAETELIRIRERQAEGIAAAKKNGVRLGRKPIDFPTGWKDDYNAWVNKEVTAASIYKKHNFSSQTFYRLIKKWENKKY